jgi:hypothetical protein
MALIELCQSGMLVEQYLHFIISTEGCPYLKLDMLFCCMIILPPSKTI